MNARQFIQAVKVAVCKAAAQGTVATLVKPPGRRPVPELATSSEWFNGLNPDDRKVIVRLINMAAEQATYNFLMVLDGLVALEPAGPKGRLELFFDDGEAKFA